MSDQGPSDHAAPAGFFSVDSEISLLQMNDNDRLRTFYSLTGPARKEFIVMMAEAEAAKVAAVGEAQAKARLQMLEAEAEGYRKLGEALAAIPNAQTVLEVAKLHTLADTARGLADGRATKMFLPSSMDALLNLLTLASESKK